MRKRGVDARVVPPQAAAAAHQHARCAAKAARGRGNDVGARGKGPHGALTRAGVPQHGRQRRARTAPAFAPGADAAPRGAAILLLLLNLLLLLLLLLFPHPLLPLLLLP